MIGHNRPKFNPHGLQLRVPFFASSITFFLKPSVAVDKRLGVSGEWWPSSLVVAAKDKVENSVAGGDKETRGVMSTQNTIVRTQRGGRRRSRGAQHGGLAIGALNTLGKEAEAWLKESTSSLDELERRLMVGDKGALARATRVAADAAAEGTDGSALLFRRVAETGGERGVAAAEGTDGRKMRRRKAAEPATEQHENREAAKRGSGGALTRTAQRPDAHRRHVCGRGQRAHRRNQQAPLQRLSAHCAREEGCASHSTLFEHVRWGS